MMDHKWLGRLLLGCCLLTAATAGAQQRYFTVNVPKAAAIALPAGEEAIERMMLVNNSVMQPASFGHQNKLNDTDTGQDTIDLRDARRQLLFGMQEALEEAMRWGEVSVLDQPQNRNKNFYRRSPLTRQQTDSLCQLYDVDALLVMNLLVLYDLQEVYLTDDDSWYAYLEVYCSSQWSLHRKGKSGSFSFTTGDTLRWSAEENLPDAAFRKLPNRQTALLDMAYYSGQQLAARLCPGWEQQDRYLYQNRDERILKGLDAFRHKRWRDAIRTWQEAAGSTDKQTSAYAWANMAVAEELQGNMNEARGCTDKAIAVFRSMKNSDALQQVINLTAYKKQLE